MRRLTKMLWHFSYREKLFGLCLLPLLLVSFRGKMPDWAAVFYGHPYLAGVQADAPQALSAQGESELRAIVESGNLPDLRWPNWPDYRVYVEKFYDSGGYALAWVTKEMQATPQALAIISVLQDADSKGLFAEDYDASRWTQRLAKFQQTNPPASESDAIHFDVALTVCVMRYVSDLHLGKINPHYFHFGLDIEGQNYDRAEFLRQRLVGAENVKAILDGVEPPLHGYRRVQQALQRYLELARQDDGEKLSVPRTPVAPEQAYPGVARLTRLLRLVGDLPPDAVVPENTHLYQGPLVDAVKHFQSRHGLAADGRLDAQTIKELNTPLSQRVRQLQLTLERWRWAPHGFSQPPVVVNIPEYRLRAFNEKGELALSMNVVVGKAYGYQTPIFADEIRYVVFRPYWNVPPSIQRAEIVPELERDRSYLERKGFEVITHSGQVIASSPVSDEILQKLRSEELEVREKPGPRNSLGLVKLIFPNSYDVYLHSTPEQELFSRSRRDFSHGCVRVEEPAQLAAWALRKNPGWNLKRVENAMKTGKDNDQVSLVQPIPVLIVYSTAIVTPEGEVHFYDDIYELDTRMEEILAKGYPYPS
jgi:murein L,D-transpeptidase YcbB/YkuD